MMSIATEAAVNTSTNAPPPSLELEQALSLLTSNRAVLGYVLLSRSQPATIIRHSGVIFDGEQGRKYVGLISRVVESVQTGLDELGGEVEADRVSTKTHRCITCLSVLTFNIGHRTSCDL